MYIEIIIPNIKGIIKGKFILLKKLLKSVINFLGLKNDRTLINGSQTLKMPAIVAPEIPGVISATPIQNPALNLYRNLDIWSYPNKEE